MACRLAALRDPFPPPSGPAVLALVAGFDLVVHEAGHPLLGLLGWRFLAILGGTLAQLALPVAALAAFGGRRQPASFATAAVWLGANLVEVGRYAADGDARLLPLLGADADGHDWWNMLGALGLRGHAPAIGGVIGALGWALHLAAPGWALARWLALRLDAAAAS